MDRIQLETLEYLYNLGVDIHRDCDILCHYAANYGRRDIVEFYLDHGTSVDAYDNALIRHAFNMESGFDNAFRTCRLLIDRGANIDAVDIDNALVVSTEPLSVVHLDDMCRLYIRQKEQRY